jgi:hypothetical protein
VSAALGPFLNYIIIGEHQAVLKYVQAFRKNTLSLVAAS